MAALPSAASSSGPAGSPPESSVSQLTPLNARDALRQPCLGRAVSQSIRPPGLARGSHPAGSSTNRNPGLPSGSPGLTRPSSWRRVASAGWFWSTRESHGGQSVQAWVGELTINRGKILISSQIHLADPLSLLDSDPEQGMEARSGLRTRSGMVDSCAPIVQLMDLQLPQFC